MSLKSNRFSRRGLLKGVSAGTMAAMIGAPSILTEGLEVGATGGMLAVASLAPRAAVAVEQA